MSDNFTIKVHVLRAYIVTNARQMQAIPICPASMHGMMHQLVAGSCTGKHLQVFDPVLERASPCLRSHLWPYRRVLPSAPDPQVLAISSGCNVVPAAKGQSCRRAAQGPPRVPLATQAR